MSEFIAANDTWEAGGKTWTLSPIGLKELRELETYFKAEAFGFVKSLEGLSSEERRYLLDKAWAEVRNMKIGTVAFDAAMTSMSGICHLMFLCLRKNHSELSKSDVEAMVTFDNMEDLMGKLSGLMGVKSPDPLPKAEASPPTKTKSGKTSR